MIKSLVAATFALAASSAFAFTPAIHDVVKTLGDAQDKTLLRLCSTVCLGNIDVDKTIGAQCREGTDGE